ncbi:hypothetical protein ACI8AK_05345 [Geodermatophilus sp. SYSU D00867]
MSTTEEWGAHAFTAAMQEVTTVPEPSPGRTPLEHEVLDLSQVVFSPGGPPPSGLQNLDGSWWERVSRVVVDAVLARDKAAVDLLDGLLRRLNRALAVAQHEEASRNAPGPRLDALRQAECWLHMAMEFVRTAQERIAPVAFAAAVAGTRAESFLRIVEQEPGINSRGIRERMRETTLAGGGRGAAIDEAQLSRLGKKLRTDRLVVATRGRSGLSWELSPLGALVLEHVRQTRVRVPRPRRAQPVDNMLIAVGASTASEVVTATLSASEPREITVLRDEESVTYERRDLSSRAVSGDEPVPVAAAVHDLVDEPAASTRPSTFSLGNGVVYEQVP